MNPLQKNAVDLALRSLDAMERRDLDEARLCFAPAFVMVFPGPVAFSDLDAMVVGSASRYRSVGKHIEATEAWDAGPDGTSGAAGHGEAGHGEAGHGEAGHGEARDGGRGHAEVRARGAGAGDHVSVVYVRGTLFGVNVHGVPFEGVRFIDRFEVHRGLIRRQDVWNDLSESGELERRG